MHCTKTGSNGWCSDLNIPLTIHGCMPVFVLWYMTLVLLCKWLQIRGMFKKILIFTYTVIMPHYWESLLIHQSIGNKDMPFYVGCFMFTHVNGCYHHYIAKKCSRMDETICMLGIAGAFSCFMPALVHTLLYIQNQIVSFE